MSTDSHEDNFFDTEYSSSGMDTDVADVKAYEPSPISEISFRRLKIARRIILSIATVALVVAFVSPTAVVWASHWRPWRTEVQIERGLEDVGWIDSALSLGATHQYMVSWHQFIPNEFGNRDQDNGRVVYVSRLLGIGPWIIVDSGTGP